MTKPFRSYPKPLPRQRKPKQPIKRTAIKKKYVKSNTSEMSYPDAVKYADKWLSEFVRISAADEKGMVKCFTCPKVFHYKEMDCGHFVGRKYIMWRYELKNTAPQCKECNQLKDGNLEVFEKKLIERDGQDSVDLLIENKRFNPSFHKHDLIKIGNLYKAKVIILKKEKSL